MFLPLLVVLIVCFISYLIHTLIPIYTYWTKRNIPHISLTTALKRMFLRYESFFESVKKDYEKFSGKRYYGSYISFVPTLMIKDLDLVKQIFVRDFEHFTNRMDFLGASSDPIFKQNLLAAKGKEWKELRTTISPVFTNARMKAMFYLIAEKAKAFVKYYDDLERETVDFEVKDSYARFTNDVIASCVFGIQCNSLEDPENEVLIAGKDVTRFLPFRSVWILFTTLFPKLIRVFKVNVFQKELSLFFKNMITDSIRAREKEGIIRPDLLHLLMEARKGKLEEEDSTKVIEDTGFATVTESKDLKIKSTLKITDDLITAQALIFYIAGHEASSSLLTFLSYELALQPDIQQKLIREVDKNISSIDKISFETLTNMKYLDQVVTEALRKWPTAFLIVRRSTKDYVVEPKEEWESRLTIPKGSFVIAHVVGAQNDPKYYKNPDLFDPERFSDKNKKNVVPGSYAPFGVGPRNCIGARFALLEMKCLVAAILSKFEIHTTSETQIPLKLTCTFPLKIDGQVKLAFKRRKN